MNMLEALYSRKSVRSYTAEAVTDAELKEILKAAWASPVGRAQYDSLHLTVITNPDYLSRWKNHAAAAFGEPGMDPFYGAPVLILVSSTVAPAPACNVNYSNAAIVVHNMALAAVGLGLGACHIWGSVTALNGSEELVGELKLPEGMVPCCAIALGHTEEKYEVREIQEERIRTGYLK